MSRKVVARLVGKGIATDRLFHRECDRPARLAYLCLAVCVAPGEVVPLPPESWPDRYGIELITPLEFAWALPQWYRAQLVGDVPSGIVLTAEWLGRASREARESVWGNWIDPAARQRIYARDGFACRYCDSVENLSLDHVHPASRGGSDRPSNLVTCCRSCNSKKHARTPEEAGMTLRPPPRLEA